MFGLDLVEAAHAAYPGSDVHLLGESMGGGVIINAAAELRGITSTILAAPGVREGVRFRYGFNALLAMFSLFAPGVTVTNDQTDPPLTDTANRRLGKDPRVVNQVRIDTYLGLLRFADAASENAAKLRVPTLLIYGGADGFVIRPSICAFVRDAPGPVTTRVVRGGVHRILHQAGKRVVLADILRWLDGPGEPLPDDPSLMSVEELCAG